MRRAGMLIGIALLCSVSAPAWGESDAERVQSDVRSLIEALYRGDAATVLSFTHPQVIRGIGGDAAARAATEQALKQIALVGIALESLEFPKPPEFMQGKGREFAIVPTRIVLSSGGRRVESLNFQLGVKEPGAADWKYVEGSDVNESNVQMLFPGFPVSYEFPLISRKLL